MMLEISRDALAAIHAAAEASPDAEVCGLLLGKGLRVERVVACRNVCDEPATTFEIDPRALIAAHRAARAGGPALIGHYHSHPTGRAEPSARDAANAAGDGSVWMIVAGTDVRAWRSTVRGRFDPIALSVSPDEPIL